MSDGRIGSLVQRVGLMFLWVSIVTCMWPNDRGSVQTGGWSSYYGREAAANAAEAPQADQSMPRGANKPNPMPVSGSNETALDAKSQEAAEVQEALGRIKDHSFADLNMKDLEKVEVVATGYTAGKESTGKTPGHPEYGITYSGVKVRKGEFSTIAADPKVFPIGTVMYIPGYGFGVVADTGGAIKGHKIDLFFTTKQQVYKEWGKRKVHVYILRKGDGKVTEAMMNGLNDSTEAVPAEVPSPESRKEAK